MTLLDLLFKVDKEKNFEDYIQPFEYWSVDTEGSFLFLTCREEQNMFNDVTKVDTKNCVDKFIPYIWDNCCLEKPFFIPYEQIEPYSKILVEIDSPVYYEGSQKYPLVCVRGTCDKQCVKKDFDSYCFRELPCTDKRPDWNVWSCKYPDFFDLLYDAAAFTQTCPHTDTLVVMFVFTPYSRDRNLNFNYSEAILIRDSNITIIGNSSKIEALYREYNSKYPTQDRQIEDSISEPENNFYFKF